MKPAQSLGPATHRPLAHLRVLIVDDDRIPRRIVSNAVSRAGGEPFEAEDGSAALALISSVEFDAAVIDFVMPGLDGADLVQAMRELGFKGPVIGLSGKATEAQTLSWVAAGCDEVLPKGVMMTELITELGAAYRRRKNRTEFRRH